MVRPWTAAAADQQPSTPVRPATPLHPDQLFWVVRASAMLCALISVLLFCDVRVGRWPWFVRVNLLINIPGLTACSFFIMRYVLVNTPSPG
jgi:hypothetical protein